jgi:hypothetical protein
MVQALEYLPLIEESLTDVALHQFIILVAPTDGEAAYAHLRDMNRTAGAASTRNGPQLDLASSSCRSHSVYYTYNSILVRVQRPPKGSSDATTTSPVAVRRQSNH